MEIVLSSLLEVFDYDTSENSQHASAINGVLGEDLALALTLHYFNDTGNTPIVLSRRCTQGKKRGKRLDAWLKANIAGESVRLQTEIKNWTAHSIGGESIPRDARYDDLSDYRVRRWNKRFNSTLGKPRDEDAQKVLLPMKYDSDGLLVKPLIIFWESMHPKGLEEPFFEVDVVSDSFSTLFVFSLSNYVRVLISKGMNTLIVEMPSTRMRMNLLQSIVKI